LGISRRTFLKGGGVAGAGVAATRLADLGVDLQPSQARAQTLRIRGAKQVPSICPYCAVGCGQIVHVEDDKIVNIEGNPDSPINRGNLCAKGAASFQLAVNENRITRPLYRAPGSTRWEEKSLSWMMDQIAQRLKQTRDETFVERTPDRKLVNHTLAIFSLGGATMDNEWNHVHQKLMRGLGVVAIENQGRI
jgi:formate dehydrogenase major subunit